MRFCPNCNNILIPKSKRLYCKVCEAYFNFVINTEEYMIMQTIKHDNNESCIIVTDGIKHDKITPNDREAFEDYFQTL